ncbi:beta strand repeat-containing protein [Halovenus halobia]|uniref:beta strand repeat-containing protein n=1 Tax=Halovenus halobia TaxID=3396622 RepID=UPI003F55E1C6
MGARKAVGRRRRYNFTDTARILAITLLLVAVAGAGIGLAPTTATADASVTEAGPQPTTTGSFFFEDEPDFTVEAEDTTIESGSSGTVDVEIEPTEDSGFGAFIPDNERINWFVITVEYNDEKLDFEGVAGSQVGEVEVTENNPGQLTIENGYDFGDYFLDPDEAPATLAELEFSASDNANGEASVTPTEDSNVGWGPPFLKDLSSFQHDVEYKSGTLNVVGSDGGDDGDDGDGSPQTTLSATNTGGFISFGTDSASAARSEGITFPEEGIQIEAEVNDDGTWESTSAEFPAVTTSGIEAEVSAPNGLTGKIDTEENFLTVEGELEVSVLGDAFSFSIAPTTGNSGALSGSADLSAEGGSATVVDNQYIVDDSTGNLLVDSQLGLPIEESGQNWLELPLSVSISQADDGGDEPKTGSLEVSASDQNGGAIEGATVTVDGQTAQTDASGVATFSGLATGTYDVTVEAEGESASTQATVEADATTTADVTVELPPETGSLEVSASDQDGNALDGATVTVDGQTAQTDASGVATFSGLETGTYDVTVEAEGESATTQATVEADSTTTTDVTVELPAETGTLEVSVSDQDGSALDATVEVGGKSESTDSGVATFDLAPGDYDVTVEAAGQSVTTQATVEADSTTTADVTVEVEQVAVESFRAESSGGFISFDETSLDSAIAEGLSFPDGSGDKDPIVIEAQVNDDGTWESTTVDFPLLNTAEDGSGFDAKATAPNGLEGTFNPTTGVATAEGTLKIELPLTGDSFSFDIAMTTGVSNGAATDDGLEGTFNVNKDSGTLAFVDNEYTVPEPTGNQLLDTQLGLPIEEPGLAWLKLPLDVDFESSSGSQTGSLDVSASDQNGEAIEGATVSVNGQTAQTDASGVATFSGLETGTYDVTVEAEGESATTQATVEADSTTTTDVTVELPPETGTLEVSASDQNGNALEGATVSVNGQTTQTDASGVATFSGLETGTYDVTVEAEGESATAQATVEADSTTTADVTVELPPETGTLEVSVSDQDGNALDATVSVNGQSGSTDGGAVSFELTPGDYDVSIEAAGQTVTTQATVEAGSTTTKSVTVETEQIAVESFRAESSGGFISFDETSLDSAIAEGLSFPDGSGDSEPIVIEAQVNDDGTWESTTVDFPTLNTAEDGSGFDAEATAPNGLEGTFNPTTGVATAEGTLKIKLPLTGDSFSFDIAMTTGVSNGAATDDGLEGAFNAGENSGSLTFVDNEYTVPEPTGNQLLDTQLGLPIEEPGLAWLKLPLDVDFESSSGPQTGSLDVSASDQNGNALEGATVTVDGQTAQTDASGVATFSDLETGTYDVTVETGEQTATTQATVEADSTTTTDVTVELPPETGSLEVSASDQDGNAIEGATVSVNGQTAQTDASGVATFSGLETGTYDVTVEAEGESATTQATVEADATTTADVTVELPAETGSLEVSVSNQDGAAVEDAAVSVAGQSAQTNANGVATFSGLESGTYDVTVEAEDKSARTQATVQSDSTTMVAVALELTRSYSFTATNTGGFISFDETSLDSARANGIAFPTEAEDGEGIVIEGQVEGDQWESTNVSFPTLTTSSNFDAKATAPNGLQGTIDRENNEMTATGTLKVTLPLTGDSFSFEVTLVSELSNGTASEDGLEGSADFENNQATLVDNEYIVPEESGNALLDGQLGLPITEEESGIAWLELPFEFEFSDE